MRAVIVAAAIGCAAMGGVFFAFSTFVMPALKRLPPAQGIAAMQSINITAVTPMFMTLLFGTAALCLGLGAQAAIAGRPYVVAGSLSYLIGAIVVTIARNVPLNNALATADPSGSGAAQLWTHYVRTWTAWNHVRTVSGFIAAALLLF